MQKNVDGCAYRFQRRSLEDRLRSRDEITKDDENRPCCRPLPVAASTGHPEPPIGAVIVTFMLTRVLPGDTGGLYFAGRLATPAAIAEIRAKLGLTCRCPFSSRTTSLTRARQSRLVAERPANRS